MQNNDQRVTEIPWVQVHLSSRHKDQAARNRQVQIYVRETMG